MASYSLTQIATAAGQFLGVVDSGEGLSTQQLADALAAANDLLENWTVEQVRLMNAILATFTLGGGTYTPASTIQFADTTTPVALPTGYGRALKLGLAIELAPQFSMKASPELVKDYTDARASASPMVAAIRASAPQAIGPKGE